MKKLLTLAALLVAMLCVFSACKNEKETASFETEKITGQAAGKKEEPQKSSSEEGIAKEDGKLAASKKEEVPKKDAKEAEASEPAADISPQPSGDSAAEVEEISSEFIKKLFGGNSSALDYTEAGSEAYLSAKEIISSIDSVRAELDLISTNFAASGLDGETVESISQRTQQWYNEVSQMVDIKKADSQITGDDATVNIVFAAPDFSLMDGFMSDENMDAAVAEIYSDDYFAKLSSLSEDEQLAEFNRMMVEVFNRMFEKAAENIENNKKQESMTLKIKKIGSSWLIV